MDILIKNATILHRESKFHQQKKDIRLRDGRIAEISENLKAENDETVIEGRELYCSIGLFDMGTRSGEPGYEHRETIQSLTTAALKGGFTGLAIFPNNHPITQTRADVRYLSTHPDRQSVKIYPLAALSNNLEGRDINEYHDLAIEGVVAITDGMQPIQDTGLLNRALRYSAPLDMPVINHPSDKYLSEGGQMHEGKMSTSLGLKGIPDYAEAEMVQRDLHILQYNEGRIIEYGISAEKSLDLIRKKKDEGLKVAATVPYLNLIFTDEKLLNFETHFKVKPVLRSEQDRKSLVDGLKNGTIDAIVTNHTPLEIEQHDIEFPFADFGATGLETCLPALIDDLGGSEVDLSVIIHALSVAPRRLLSVEVPQIEVGAEADLCVFDISSQWQYDKKVVGSASINNPFINHEFNTEVKATIIGKTCMMS